LQVVAVWRFFNLIFRIAFRLFKITVFLVHEWLTPDCVDFNFRASELTDFDRLGHDGRQKAPVVLIDVTDAAAIIREICSLSSFFGSSACIVALALFL
jgi:hypothetical protein